MNQLIKVVDLTKVFSSAHEKVIAVDHVCFSVAAGEVYGLLGPNGAGKTTTLRMILGLLQPTSGYAEVGGLRSSDAPDQIKQQIGLVSASAGLYQWLSPRELLLFFADVYGVDPETAQQRLESLSKQFDLTSFIDRRCAHLSTGQKQRVQLARALIHNPHIVLLDEPTRGLDVIGSQAIFDYVTALRQQGRAVIVSTHRLHEAQLLCDRFGLLHQGKIRNEGTLEQLQQQTGHESLVDMFMQSIKSAELAT